MTKQKPVKEKTAKDYNPAPTQIDPPNVTKEFSKQVMDKRLPMIRLPLITRLFGKKMLRAKMGQGFIIGEIVLPNRMTKHLLVDLRAGSFRESVGENREKMFMLAPVKEHPEKYIKNVGGFQLASFDYETGMPLAISKAKETDWDDEYYADIVMQASLVSGTAEMLEIIKKMKNYQGAATITMICTILTLALVSLQWLGFL